MGGGGSDGPRCGYLVNGSERYTVTRPNCFRAIRDTNGDTLYVTASEGSVTDNNNGTWTITSPAKDNGPVTLTYTVSDGNGAMVQIATLTKNLTLTNNDFVVWP